MKLQSGIIDIDFHQLLNWSKSQELKKIPLDRLSKIIDLLPSLVRASYAFQTKEKAECKGLRECDLPQPIEHCGLIVFCLCTIGEKLELKVSELMKNNRYSDAYVLDLMGSLSASFLAEKIAFLARDIAHSKGLRVSRVFEPGAGSSKWPLEGQRFIFQNIDGEKMGVELSKDLCMKPLKSLSFIMGMDESIDEPPNLVSCAGCPKKNCFYRR